MQDRPSPSQRATNLAWTRGNREDIVVRSFASVGVQFDQLDAGPERSESQPPPSRGIDDEITINSVEVAPCIGLDHETLVGPLAGQSSLAGGEKDGRDGRSK